nr:MAG TPA: hypothetical protein [Caudoviricetes sp.]
MSQDGQKGCRMGGLKKSTDELSSYVAIVYEHSYPPINPKPPRCFSGGSDI